MKNRLQYFYSISIFVGVIVAAYLMMNQDSTMRMPIRSVAGPIYRTEAAMMDAAVSELFQVEKELRQLPERKPSRRPTRDSSSSQ